jgi:murein DD-endopeptidase MepM/ murein hydrolase activator NlpD
LPPERRPTEPPKPSGPAVLAPSGRGCYSPCVSFKGATPSRHLGRIEDPSVRDDGLDEPAYNRNAELDSSPALPSPEAVGPATEPSVVTREPAAEAAPIEPSVATREPAAEAAPIEPSVVSPAPPEVTPPPASSPEAQLRRTGHPVRDRLLAKAALQREAAVERAEPTFSSLGAVENELLKVASSARPRSSSVVRIGGAPLSSTATLLLGTLFGLAGFALLFALLIQLAPRDPAAVALAESSENENATQAPSAPPPLAEPIAPPPRQRLPGPWRIELAKPGQRIVRGRIGKEPFLKAVADAGIATAQVYRVFTALKTERNLDRCKSSDEFVALLDSAGGRVLAFEYIVSKEEVYQAREDNDGLLKGKALDLKVERRRVQGALTMLSTSFAESARLAHFDPGLGAVIDKALDGHITVDEFRPGDRLRVVALEVTVLGEFSRYAGLEAMEYQPVQGDAIRIYYFPERSRYYDAKGRAPGEGVWRKPVKGAPITSKFNLARLHPILKKRMPHNGTDFGAPTGAPIYAASSGKIIKLGNYGPNGNFIGIEHRGGYETGYSHLSRFEAGLAVGDEVKRLQLIGYVGSTGRSTGPHLHFSAKKAGKFIDPESLGLDALTTLPKAELTVFQQIKAKYDALLQEIPLPEAIAVPQPAAAEIESAVASAGEDAQQDLEFAEGAAESATPEASPQPAQGASSAEVVPARNATAPALTPQPKVGASLYLTDRELLEAQSRTDDGEVEE